MDVDTNMDDNIIVSGRIILVHHNRQDSVLPVLNRSRNDATALPERYNYLPEYFICTESDLADYSEVGEHVTLQYLAEGGANVIFRIRTSTPGIFPSPQLLRVRKGVRFHSGSHDSILTPPTTATKVTQSRETDSVHHLSPPTSPHSTPPPSLRINETDPYNHALEEPAIGTTTAVRLLRHIDQTIYTQAGIPCDWVVPHILVGLTDALVDSLNNLLVRMEGLCTLKGKNEQHSVADTTITSSLVEQPRPCASVRSKHRIGTYIDTESMELGVDFSSPLSSCKNEGGQYKSLFLSSFPISPFSSSSPSSIIFTTSALLLRDFSPSPPELVFGFDFKPKWLVQSPNAPAGSRRCRTCALEALRRRRKRERRMAKEEQEGGIGGDERACASAKTKAASPSSRGCPLRILSLDYKNVKKEVYRLIRLYEKIPPEGLQHGSCPFIGGGDAQGEFRGEADEGLREGREEWQRQQPRPNADFLYSVADTLTDFFFSGKGRDILITLRELQMSLDPYGVLSTVPASLPVPEPEGADDPAADDSYAQEDVWSQSLLNLQLAMTLRDCSLFVRVTPGGGVNVNSGRSVTDDEGKSEDQESSIFSSLPAIIDAQLADVDVKNISMKANYWRRLEEDMIEEGVYEGLSSRRKIQEGERMVGYLSTYEDDDGEHEEGDDNDNDDDEEEEGEEEVCMLWRTPL